MISMALLDTIRSSALDALLAHPEGSGVIRDYAKKLREGYWSREYVDAIGAGGRRLSMEEIAVFARLHTMIFEGLVGMVLVEVGSSPGPDCERQANADALACLAHPFTATVDRHQFNDPRDGILTWDEPISISLATRLRADHEIMYAVHYAIPPGWAPLEIGNSPPSRTLQHLVADEGTLARWPYGQEQIRLFVNFDFHPRKRGFPLPLTPG